MSSEGKPLGIRKVGIVGLGLIGGSLAKAIHGRTDIKEIVAIDKDEASLKMAEEEGVITGSSCDDVSILSGCDVVILCAPVDVIKNMQDDLAKVDIGMITDVGSVKQPVIRTLSVVIRWQDRSVTDMRAAMVRSSKMHFM